MTKADRVLSTPPLNSSSIQEGNPPLEARAESVDSFSSQSAVGQRESANRTGESGKRSDGLSRRNAFAVLVAIPSIPVVLPAIAAAPDPIYAAIERHKQTAAVRRSHTSESRCATTAPICRTISFWKLEAMPRIPWAGLTPSWRRSRPLRPMSERRCSHEQCEIDAAISEPGSRSFGFF
jgi:hypothetical protein